MVITKKVIVIIGFLYDKEKLNNYLKELKEKYKRERKELSRKKELADKKEKEERRKLYEKLKKEFEIDK
jgi:malonyl CoA-acyl carrier protein transacylase